MPKNKKAKHFHPEQSSSNTTSLNGELSHAEIWDDSALVRSWNEAVKEYEYYHSLAAQGLDIEAVLDAAEAAEAEGSDVPLALPASEIDVVAPPVSGGSTELGLEIARNGHKQSRTHLETDRGDLSQEVEVEDGELMSENEHHSSRNQSSQDPYTVAKDTREPTAKEREAALRRLGVLDRDVALPAPVPAPPTPAPPAPANDAVVSGIPAAQADLKPAVEQPTSAATTVAATTAAPTSAPIGPDQLLENVKMAYYWAGYYSGLYDEQQRRPGAANNNSGDSNTGERA